MVIRTMVAVVFFVACALVMHQVFRMLDQCVPASKEPIAQKRAWRWRGAVAAVVVAAWVCGAGIALGLDMPKVLRIVVFAGPIVITFPALVWVLLVK